MTSPLRATLFPHGQREFLIPVLEGAGAVLGEPDDAEMMLWTSHKGYTELDEVLTANPNIKWIQFPFAGIEPELPAVRAHADRLWTAGKGVFGPPVGELAFTLLLAGLRKIGGYANATAWSRPTGSRNLFGTRVTVLGGGGITEALLKMLAPFGCEVTVVRRSDAPVTGADRVLTADRIDEALTGAQAVVVALAMADDTVGLLDARRLALLEPGAAVVNIARGAHIVTDDLVAALESGQVGSAGLDVTDPEPLPEGHPLWSMPNVIVTPHVGNASEMSRELLSARVTENIRRYVAGEPLLGIVDPELGY